MATKKKVGWGKCTLSEKATAQGEAVTYSDIAINTCKLSVEEGDETEAQIEGGEAEARKKNPDKYTVVAERRIEDPTEVNDVLGFTDEIASVEIVPESVGACGVKLVNPSRHVAVSYDTTDGMKAIYTYKTKGATDPSTGKLTDITFQKKVAG